MKQLVSSGLVVFALVFSSLVFASECPTIKGVDQVLSNSHGVFIGDIHGTNESPAFLTALACHAVVDHRKIVIALEYPATDQPELDAFMAATDHVSAERALLETGYWRTSGLQDGRRSIAMLQALGRLRELKLANASVEVVAYDTWVRKSSPNSNVEKPDRDLASAEFLNAQRTKLGPEKYWIVFGGNFHARKSAELPRFTNVTTSMVNVPLGYRLLDWNLIHLDASYKGGAAWTCSSQDRDRELKCGVRAVSSTTAEPLNELSIELGIRSPAFDGVYNVGALTPSVPAVEGVKDLR